MSGACNTARLAWQVLATQPASPCMRIATPAGSEARRGTSTVLETQPASPGRRFAIRFVTDALVSTVLATQPAFLGPRVAILFLTGAP